MKNENNLPEEIYLKYWKEIIENPDGSINLEQLKKELADFHVVIHEVSKVYDHITHSLLSKPTYKAETVIEAYELAKEREWQNYKEVDKKYGVCSLCEQDIKNV